MSLTIYLGISPGVLPGKFLQVSLEMPLGSLTEIHQGIYLRIPLRVVLETLPVFFFLRIHSRLLPGILSAVLPRFFSKVPEEIPPEFLPGNHPELLRNTAEFLQEISKRFAKVLF